MNSHVLYDVCSFNTMIEVPSFGIPTPTNGAPPPVKLVADWLATPGEPEVVDPEVSVPLVAPPAVVVEPVVEVEPVVGELVPPKLLVPGDEEPKALDPDDESPNALDPDEEAPNALDPDDDEPYAPEPGDPNADGELEPVAPAPIPPEEASPAADPNPGANPVSGLPKNPFTVVFASPTWISRQSAFPVIGST
jgi:hypothetical protein